MDKTDDYHNFKKNRENVKWNVKIILMEILKDLHFKLIESELGGKSGKHLHVLVRQLKIK